MKYIEINIQALQNKLITENSVPAPPFWEAHSPIICVIPSKAISQDIDWLYSDVAVQTAPMLESATFCQPCTGKHEHWSKSSCNENAI